MSAYYRLTDEAVLDLDPSFVVTLSPNKQAVLRPYVEDVRPAPTQTENVRRGPVVVSETEARLTWVMEPKSPEQMAAEAFAAVRELELAQVRQVYSAMKNGTGTQLQRTTRLEQVMCRLLKDLFGEEPA